MTITATYTRHVPSASRAVAAAGAQMAGGRVALNVTALAARFAR